MEFCLAKGSLVHLNLYEKSLNSPDNKNYAPVSEGVTNVNISSKNVSICGGAGNTSIQNKVCTKLRTCLNTDGKPMRLAFSNPSPKGCIRMRTSFWMKAQLSGTVLQELLAVFGKDTRIKLEFVDVEVHWWKDYPISKCTYADGNYSLRTRAMEIVCLDSGGCTSECHMKVPGSWGIGLFNSFRPTSHLTASLTVSLVLPDDYAFNCATADAVAFASSQKVD